MKGASGHGLIAIKNMPTIEIALHGTCDHQNLPVPMTTLVVLVTWIASLSTCTLGNGLIEQVDGVAFYD